MNERVLHDLTRQFAQKVHSIGRTHEHLTAVRGTTHKEATLLDLYKAVALLVDALDEGKDAYRQQLHEVRGKVQVANLTNVIGNKDIIEFMNDLDNIEEKL